jgi:hypothetical protein
LNIPGAWAGNTKNPAPASWFLAGSGHYVRLNPNGFTGLLAEPQFLDQLPVFFQIRPLQVLQNTAPLAYQNQKPALAGLVFFELLAMIRKLVNPPGQQRNLDFRRAGIFFVFTEPGYEGSYFFFV